MQIHRMLRRSRRRDPPRPPPLPRRNPCCHTRVDDALDDKSASAAFWQGHRLPAYSRHPVRQTAVARTCSFHASPRYPVGARRRHDHRPLAPPFLFLSATSSVAKAGQCHRELYSSISAKASAFSNGHRRVPVIMLKMHGSERRGRSSQQSASTAAASPPREQRKICVRRPLTLCTASSRYWLGPSAASPALALRLRLRSDFIPCFFTSSSGAFPHLQ